LALEAGVTTGGVDASRLGDVLRAAHNVKSAVAMMGLPEAADAAHAMETVLEEARAGRALDQATVTRLLGGVDTLRGLLARSLAVGPSRPPALTPTGPRDVRLLVRFSEDALAKDLDPLALLRAVADLGTIVHARTDDADLPPLEALDPARLYLRFEVV